ncbi:MAG: hypothetical protein ACJASI_002433 [Glaciecola sp.]|jgi:hypothetical protein
MNSTRLPRNNFDLSTTGAPARYSSGVYIPPFIADACRAVQLGEAVLLRNPVSPYEIPQIMSENTCEGKSKDKSIGFGDNQ